MIGRALALAGLWLAISGVAFAAPGCFGHNCESGTNTFGTSAGQGRMLDENTWESTPQEGKWLWFPRQQLYIFELRGLNGRTPQIVLPYISAQAEPNKGGSFTVGGGNLTLLTNASPNRIDVKNDTCSDYYLRLVVMAAPLPPPNDAGHVAPEVEAGAPDDLDAGDAGVADAEAGP